MRRKDREQPYEWALKCADRSVWATLCTVNADGSPYGTPVSIVREGERVYFHCAPEGQKVDNMRRDDRVALVCVGQAREPADRFTVEYESAVLRGRARELSGAAEKVRCLRLLCLRHTPANMAAFDAEIAALLPRTAVWEVTITEATGKRNAPKTAA
ncbi:MAG: pyridoxamine 5'-phosphate oxidase family protein [Treponema sp.]|jgi:nitroimidazol reductase NimA-like FMN-containing flavoprotein (pyridoxamine 5'-phosphate oxidase superfamily)|nr:pyridoxamine 5'-phosphate oxidase family protein [Treponema sp.]